MRNRDAEVLRAVASIKDGGGFLPYRGALSTARKLVREGLLVKGGISAMPPHELFFLTDVGREVVRFNELGVKMDD